MDEFSSRKTARGLSFSRKASSGLVLRDSAENRDRSAQVCSRVGCSGRMNSTKSDQVGCSGKAKTMKHPYHLSGSGKEVTGSSSRTPVALCGPRKLSSEPREKWPSHHISVLETSNLSEESETSEPVIKRDYAQIRLNTLVENNVSGEASSSSSNPHSRHGKKTMRRSELGIYDSSMGSSASLVFEHSNHGVRDGASTSKYNLKNLKCNSINDVVSSGCSSSSTSLASSSSSELNLDRKREMGRKRIGETECSLSTRGKKINEPLLDNRRNDSSNRGISISNSRRTRNSTFTRDNDATFVRGQRSTARARLSEREDRNRLRQIESSIFMPLLPRPGMTIDANASSSYQLSSQHSSNQINASGRADNSRANIYGNRSLAPLDAGFGSSFVNRDNVDQCSLDGIAEMLLALDRIEQHEEMTYEQLLVLERNLFLSGLAFHDQHRDMRLDIDNMSYEELLALEERIGTVSTALTEEALAKCLKKSIYQATATEEGTVVGEEGDDITCSICQEGYRDGNEVGRLGCEHQYHVECIQQWLRLKNWCPICKAFAASSRSPTPLASPLSSGSDS